MTNEQDIVSFQKKLEERGFVFSNRLLEELLKGKMQRLREQSEQLEKLRSTRRHKSQKCIAERGRGSTQTCQTGGAPDETAGGNS